jgi:hypothetical protein
MKYMLLIHHGDAQTPDNQEAWEKLSENERKQVYADYQAINETPGVTPGQRLVPPQEATTVRVEGKKMIKTDGPFAESKEAVGGWFMFETDDEGAVFELAARVPAARMGGGVEVRRIMEQGY